MGLGATVACRCWEEGLCRPPISLAPRLWYDPETGEVEQTTPNNLSAEEALALDLEFDRWIDQACVHESMCIAIEHISNWSGLRAFQHALRSLGPASYAALLREIPGHNGGMTKPADARTCLSELDSFCATESFGQLVELVDADSGAVLHSRVEPYHGWLGTTAAGISHRLNADGTFQIEMGQAGVMQHDPGAEILFRSAAFRQTKTPTGEFCFTDQRTGKQVFCTWGIEDDSGLHPTLLEMRQSKDSPDRYAYCIAPLQRVFEAAVDTGHPVLWR